MAGCLAVGMLIKWRSLKFNVLFTSVEKWMLLFLLWIWISYLPHSSQSSPEVIEVLEKMTKVFIFLFMLSHLVTGPEEFRVVTWIFIIGGVLFAVRAMTAPDWVFYHGRLEELGGPDFKGSNPFALQLAVSLIFAAGAFMQFKLLGRAFLACAMAMMLNTIIMTRGRGAFLAMIVAGFVALLAIPKAYRRLAVVAMVVGLIALGLLADVGYWQRIATIRQAEDRSATTRLELWTAGLKMAQDHPFGVGPGRYAMVVGEYDRTHAGRDTHNTFLRCACELGIPGLFILIVILVKTCMRTWQIRQEFIKDPPGKLLALAPFTLLVSLTIFIAGGMTSTVLYVEGMWWLIGLAVCLDRIALNLAEESRKKPDAKRKRFVRHGSSSNLTRLKPATNK